MSSASICAQIVSVFAMANLPHRGIQSFAVSHDFEYSSSERTAEVYKSVIAPEDAMQHECKYPLSESNLHFLDMPISLLYNKTKLAHFVDTVTHFDAAFDVERVTEAMAKGDYMSLPGQLAPKCSPPGVGFMMQMNMMADQQHPGKHNVVKNSVFLSPSRTRSLSRACAKGRPAPSITELIPRTGTRCSSICLFGSLGTRGTPCPSRARRRQMSVVATERA